VLTIGEKGYAFVAAREACVLTMYPDSHNPAIGFGQNDPNLKPGDVITLDRAIALFLKEGQRIAAALEKLFAGFYLTQQQIDALFSTVYNIGLGSLVRANSGLVEAVKSYARHPTSHALRDAAGRLIVDARPENVEPPFNLSRRCREALVFVSGDYGDLSTLQLWPAGKSPKNNPPDPPTLVPMPTFLKGA
jgi:GH24 family phage-related lysozyme (muramidase)